MRKGRRIAILSGVALAVVVALFAWTNWERIRLFIEFQPLGDNPHSYPEYLHRQTGIVFVGLPGGTFNMGSPEEEAGRFPWEHVHEVRLSAFVIAKYEVSEAEWQRVMGRNWSPSSGRERGRPYEADELPIDEVSWQDCQEFCKKTGLSLPTEAQWEYACRAGSNTTFSGTGPLDDIGWYKKNSANRLHPVGKKQPNGYGLYDMCGNVAEWCQDDFDQDFYKNPASRGKDPLSLSGPLHVFRGGSYYSEPRYCRAAHRGAEGDSRYTGVGFRPAYPIP